MAKVGRASRNASLMRVEDVAAGTTKVIGDAETGEIYFCDGSDDITITLPAHKAGAYFKFIVSVVVATSKSIVIQAADKTTAMRGQVILLVDDMADSGDVAAADGSDDKVTLAATTTPGSFIECVSDGTTWFVTGQTTGAAAAFASTA